MPPSASSKRPGARDGAGEGALFVPEQLALQELRGDGPAVDRDERAVAALGMIVQVARHHLLAGPGLAGDEDFGVGVGHHG